VQIHSTHLQVSSEFLIHDSIILEDDHTLDTKPDKLTQNISLICKNGCLKDLKSKLGCWLAGWLTNV